MAIITTTEIADSLSKDTQRLINLILDAQNQLNRQDIIAYFRANPDSESQLLAKAKTDLESYSLIIRGLKERLGSDVLPSIGDLDHPEGWLEVGDVFIGVVGYCHSYGVDRPYVVTEKTEEGYNWRYIDESDDTSRLPMWNDPGLRLYGWWKIPIADEENAVADIETFLDAEIEALSGYVSFLKEFSTSS